MLAFMRKARPVAAAVVVTLALGACGDDDEVRDEFSAETAQEMAGVAGEVVAPIAESEQVQANLFNAFGVLLSGGAPLSPMMPFDVIERMRSSRPSVTSFREMGPALASAGPTGLLVPDAIEGVTFVWSLDDSMYVASDAAGAPANGVRFIFYAVDPFDGYPTAPLNEVGYLDLTDESTAALARLVVEVVRDSDDETLASYFLQGSVDSTATTSTVTLDSEGFVRGDADRLDFDIRMQFSGDDVAEEDELHTTVELSTNDGSISLDHDEISTASSFESEATFVIAGEGNEAEFSFQSSGDSEEAALVDGIMSFNGVDVVVISGDSFDPDFSTPDGDDLSAQEIHAMAAMWQAFGATYLFAFLHIFPFLLLMAFSGFGA